MTVIKQVLSPNNELGNDPNDHRGSDDFMDKLQIKSVPTGLDSFALNGDSTEMKAKMLDDKYILGKLAILGQSTAIYAKPNAGKTLITIWLLIQSIKSGQINPSDVYYINADDNHKGLTYKLTLAEQSGFLMLAPGYHGFKSEMLPDVLMDMVTSDAAQGKVLILDTLKKFTDIMDKRAATKFSDVFRQFVSKGGSIIMLAHVNKHSNAEGKVLYAGTSDIVDDADCCYTLEVIDETNTEKIVEFTNFKDRGDVAKKALFSYSSTDGLLYGDLLNSIVELDDSESKRISALNTIKGILDKNGTLIDEIKDAINNGITGKVKLIEAVRNATGESKKRVIHVLKEHTGSDTRKAQFWTCRIADRNEHIYKLNNPALRSNLGGV